MFTFVCSMTFGPIGPSLDVAWVVANPGDRPARPHRMLVDDGRVQPLRPKYLLARIHHISRLEEIIPRHRFQTVRFPLHNACTFCQTWIDGDIPVFRRLGPGPACLQLISLDPPGTVPVHPIPRVPPTHLIAFA